MPFGSVFEAILAARGSHSPPLSPADNLKLYLSASLLPPMIHGSSAPPMPPEGHKAHLNHLAIQPEDYRSRFVKIVAPKTKGLFDKAVLSFVDTLPSEKLNLPTVDDATGYAFTVPAAGFDIKPPSIPRPASVQEVAPWVFTLPLQTMTRALHVAFQEATRWDITYVNRDDRDAALWSTLVWRRTPPPSKLETYFINPTDPLENCSVVFAVQPPWVMTPQDFQYFLRCTSLPPFNAWDEAENRPFTSAERVWGKLWDACVRMKCHHWVLSTYWGWVFGAFSEAYTAGQILDMKSHDSEEPTVLQCLVYHVASSMGLATGSKLPQYFETADQLEWNMDIPAPDRYGDFEHPDSGSEWDGMDDEPRISAAISNGYDGFISAWGSEQEACQYSIARVPWPEAREGYRIARLHPTRAEELLEWQEDVDDSYSERERSPSPVFSEAALSTASIYQRAMRAGSEIPEVRTVVQNGKATYGSILTTVVEQGPAEELAELGQPA